MKKKNTEKYWWNKKYNIGYYLWFFREMSERESSRDTLQNLSLRQRISV